MSSFLEILKEKPQPETKEKVVVSFLQKMSQMETPEKEEGLRPEGVEVIDKTKEQLVNRDDFLSKIKRKQLVKPLISKPVELVVEVKPEVSKEPSIVIEETERVIPKPKKETTGVPKKTGKKLKIRVVKKSKIEEYTRPEDRPVGSYKIGNEIIEKRVLAKKDFPLRVRASNYYLNNRDLFINFINSKFLIYNNAVKKEEENQDVSCDKKFGKFSLLTHQKIIKDYMNVYTPYRGLLIYHGLGSGKTCSSIAIAEGIKHHQKVIVMTPASLRQNYIEELKKCGDDLYKKDQYWEFVDAIDNEEYVTILSEVLSLPKAFIRKHKGAWLVNVNKKSNFETLTSNEKISLETQLNEMIKSKYQFINYNGMRDSILNNLTKGGTINPFKNRVVIIDEAHNFVSRVVNKLNNKKSLSYKLYEYLLSAENCRIVFLTGTPIINYPNEIGVLFNILRGYIKTYTFDLTIKTKKKVDSKVLRKMLQSVTTLDYLDYKPSTKKLIVTRNPYGFHDVFDKKNTYKGVNSLKVDSEKKPYVREETFIEKIKDILKNNDIIANKKVTINNYKALPDNMDIFNETFINESNGNLINTDLFKRRILGLTSYFRSAQEQLMPRFNKDTDLHVIKIPMSDFQLGVYEIARIQERNLEKKSGKKKKKPDGLFEETPSLYRIYSRSFCNFVFPNTIKRPYPNEENELSIDIDEDILDNATIEERLDNPDGIYGEEDREALQKDLEKKVDKTYDERIKLALFNLKQNQDEFFSPEGLKIYSPKYLEMLKTVSSPENKGLHLVYSQLRTLEGIGIFALVLEANGFAKFKIKKLPNGEWTVDISPEDRGKPTYAFYTGTETPEEKEIIRNIFNSDWKFVPQELQTQIKEISSNNHYGEIIKVLMITSSGAEGISLKNVRYVHIMEPYWHPVRMEQVIGRARRICSHDSLEEDEKTVEVFLYLMEFSDSQKDKNSEITLSKELRLNDVSKITGAILTSDEYLYETSNRKEEINKQILKTIKESSIDCSVYQKNNAKEGLQCFSLSGKSAEDFSYVPNIKGEEKDTTAKINKKTITWKANKLIVDGKNYALRKGTNEVYDFDSFLTALESGGDPILIGTLEKNEKGNDIIKFI